MARRDVQGNAPFNSGVGNAELQPEYSITRTVGMVYSPHWVQGLDFSLDWYRISISNIITPLSANDVLNNCYLNNLENYCANFARDSVTGQVTTLSRGNVNLGRLETEGYNFGVRYRMPETAYGKFAVKLDTNYLATYKSQTQADADWANYAGYWNFPRVRATRVWTGRWVRCRLTGICVTTAASAITAWMHRQVSRATTRATGRQTRVGVVALAPTRRARFPIRTSRSLGRLRGMAA